MITSQGGGNKFIPKRLSAFVCVFSILAVLTANPHHHEDDTDNEACLICILIDTIYSILITNPSSLVKSTIFCLIITAYQTIYFYHAKFFYHSRSPPIFIFTARNLPQ
jgi:hypothetical protein